MKSPGVVALSAGLREARDTVEAMALEDVGRELVVSADLFLVLLRDRDDDSGLSCLVSDPSSRLVNVKIRLLGRDLDLDRLPSFPSSSWPLGRSFSFF